MLCRFSNPRGHCLASRVCLHCFNRLGERRVPWPRFPWSCEDRGSGHLGLHHFLSFRPYPPFPTLRPSPSPETLLSPKSPSPSFPSFPPSPRPLNPLNPHQSPKPIQTQRSFHLSDHPHQTETPADATKARTARTTSSTQPRTILRKSLRKVSFVARYEVFLRQRFRFVSYLRKAGNEIHLYVMSTTNLLILFCSE